jgi:hypothetical protein
MRGGSRSSGTLRWDAVDADVTKTNVADADGEVVWSCRLAISCAWGKLKKPRPIKGFYGLAARAGLLAEPRRALLGPSFRAAPGKA